MLLRKFMNRCVSSILMSPTATRKQSTQNLINRGTIYSLSSGHGKCGVAVIRVSGPQTSNAVKKVINRHSLPAPRRCHLMKFYHPESYEAIDKGLLLWFPGPWSFTGEDCAEFQVHGGSAVTMAMYDALGSIPGLRTAEPGEFTKRAFMNNKLDLTEVEGLADLIHAETEIQRKQALRQMDGELSQLYMTWRQILVKCAANIEAYIDFSEDENIEDDVIDTVNEKVKKLCSNIENHLKDNRKGERLRSGVQVVIIGKPNVGKSSLLNLLCRRPAAIVSPTAGTTRDIIESAVNIGGYPVLLSDTAGLRQTEEDLIEVEGIRRAIKRAQEADIKIIVLDSTRHLPQIANTKDFISKHLIDLGIVSDFNDNSGSVSVNNQPVSQTDKNTTSSVKVLGIKTDLNQNSKSVNNNNQSVAKTDANINSSVKESLCYSSSNSAIDLSEVILVINKIDLVKERDIPIPSDEFQTIAKLSCVTQDGVEDFLSLLTKKIKNLCGNPLAGNPSLTQARHRTHVTNCLHHLRQYELYIELEDVVLAAHQLHLALREIGKITGKISSEEILDVIFKDFCIGK